MSLTTEALTSILCKVISIFSLTEPNQSTYPNNSQKKVRKYIVRSEKAPKNFIGL